MVINTEVVALTAYIRMSIHNKRTMTMSPDVLSMPDTCIQRHIAARTAHLAVWGPECPGVGT